MEYNARDFVGFSGDTYGGDPWAENQLSDDEGHGMSDPVDPFTARLNGAVTAPRGQDLEESSDDDFEVHGMLAELDKLTKRGEMDEWESEENTYSNRPKQSPADALRPESPSAFFAKSITDTRKDSIANYIKQVSTSTNHELDETVE